MRSQMRIISSQVRDSLSQDMRKISSIGELVFDTMTINYGVVSEDDAPITRVFRFVNKGNYAITLKGITTSCSCLKASLSKYTIKPGESAEISTEYNQKGHPGRHDRYIYLYTADSKSGASKLAATVMMTGVVTPVGEDIKEYPVKMGYFSFNVSSVSFKVNQSSKQTVKVVNTSDSARELSFSTGLLPAGITVSPSKIRIPSGGEGSVIISYDGGNTIYASEKAIPLFFEGSGLNRLSAKIDVFCVDY